MWCALSKYLIIKYSAKKFSVTAEDIKSRIIASLKRESNWHLLNKHKVLHGPAK